MSTLQLIDLATDMLQRCTYNKVLHNATTQKFYLYPLARHCSFGLCYDLVRYGHRRKVKHP